MYDSNFTKRLFKRGPWGYVLRHLESEIEIAKAEGDDEVLDFLLAQRSDDPKRDRITGLMFAIVIYCSLCVFFIKSYSYLKYEYDTKQLDGMIGFSQSEFGLFVILLVVAVLGFVLFWFKTKRQFLYGSLETTFALSSCYVSAVNFQGGFAKHESVVHLLFPILTTTYLMVRGLSNMKDGWKLNNVGDFLTKIGRIGTEPKPVPKK